MRKSLIYIIFLVASLSLIGIIVTQLFWVNHSIKLRTCDFKDHVYNGLFTVVEKFKDIKRDSIYQRKLRENLAYSPPMNEVYINGSLLLDSLLKIEFHCLKIKENYNWGVVDTNNKTLVFGNYDEKFKTALIHSEHMYPAEEVYKGKPGYMLSIFFPEQKQLIIRHMFLWVLILSATFLLIVVVTFLVFIRTILQQKKLSEMKNDFINNMTHEFKTPISTISVASEILMKPAIYESPEKTLRYVNIIFDENLRLRNQVEQVLQISLLDKNEFKLNKTLIDVHKILENSIDIFNVIIREKKGKILADLYATKTEIIADEVHFINIIANLLDNAMKYALGPPEIRIQTRDAEDGIEIIISDNGRGINAEDLKHIFKKFFRVHTGNVHDVKGFGLGLYYVKTVVDAHNGKINVKSELKKGSTFEIYFPYKSSLSSHD
jgi:two-component system, OmpR family, phosphate regulon sensor histidine kinase PhoR